MSDKQRATLDTRYWTFDAAVALQSHFPDVTFQHYRNAAEPTVTWGRLTSERLLKARIRQLENPPPLFYAGAAEDVMDS